MTEHELDIVRDAFDHALTVGAPGIAATIRGALFRSAMMRIRHQLNMPAPPIDTECVAARCVEAAG